MYVISGASGKTGSVVASTLLDLQKKVRVITRNPQNVSSLQAKGAEVYIGDTDDPKFLSQALDGAQAFYALIPVPPQAMDLFAAQSAHVNSMAQALEGSTVTHVVGISSISVPLAKGHGVTKGLKLMEETFNQLDGISTQFLRCSYFMENSLGLIGGIKTNGFMPGPIDPELKFPVVASEDVAKRAAHHLAELTFSGSNVENTVGQRFISYPEIAQVYGKAIGIDDLKYQQIPMEAFKNALTSGMGMSDSVAEAYVILTETMNSGVLYEKSQMATPEVTPTSIEDYASFFAKVYKNA